MGRALDEMRRELHRGMPMSRVTTMILMLGIMALMFTSLRNPANWRWIGGDDNEVARAPAPAVLPKDTASKEAASKDSAAAAKPDAAPTGPIDTDVDEIDFMNEARQAIEDGSLHTKPHEMPAYDHMLTWVDSQSIDMLRHRARKDVLYDDYRFNTEALRFKIVELNLNVRQIVHVDVKSPAGRDLYEVRGFTPEGGPNLFFAMIADPPEGMPIGTAINEDVKLIGYFYKIQGYYSQEQQLSSKKKAKPLLAPVVVGRLVWQAPVVNPVQKPPLWLFVSIAGVVLVGAMAWFFWVVRSRRTITLPAYRPVKDGDQEDPAVDGWLDRAQCGELTLEQAREKAAGADGAEGYGRFSDRLSGNIFYDSGESTNGHQGPSNG